jgi:hypothetical protein
MGRKKKPIFNSDLADEGGRARADNASESIRERGRADDVSDGSEIEADARGIRRREGGGDEGEARPLGRMGMGFRPGA